jgi:hypothetical protein
MTEVKTKLSVGDRVFSHYVINKATGDNGWGTIEAINHEGTNQDDEEYTTWYDVRMDHGQRELLDDAHGNWEMARLVPPHIASWYGYGVDPKAVPANG